MSKETIETPKESEENEASVASEVIEIQWEELQDLLSTRHELILTEQHLQKTLLAFEKQKARLMTRVNQLELSMYELGAQLREIKNIDNESTYELKLPSTEGEKGYFIFKE